MSSVPDLTAEVVNTIKEKRVPKKEIDVSAASDKPGEAIIDFWVKAGDLEPILIAIDMAIMRWKKTNGGTGHYEYGEIGKDADGRSRVRILLY